MTKERNAPETGRSFELIMRELQQMVRDEKHGPGRTAWQQRFDTAILEQQFSAFLG
jgi:hypothetical protein